MANAFSRLPLELLLEILQNVPDLPSLYRFICASAKANAAFEFDPTLVLKKAIDRSIPHFRHLARMIAIMDSLNIGIGTGMRPAFDLNFYSLIAKVHSLPGDTLTTAVPSNAFAANTPGAELATYCSLLIVSSISLICVSSVFCKISGN